MSVYFMKHPAHKEPNYVAKLGLTPGCYVNKGVFVKSSHSLANYHTGPYQPKHKWHGVSCYTNKKDDPFVPKQLDIY